MTYTTKPVSVDQLLLDPNNYRFFDMDDYSKVANNRIHEITVQERAEQLIRRDGKEELRVLKESIETNGYVPLEILVVQPYTFRENLFVVVEGNRRVAAMRWLKKDREGGSAISEELIKTFDNLSAIVIDEEKPGNQGLRHILMGLRHVSGIKQWGGYQRAKIVVESVDDFGLPINIAAKQIGMSSHEASRRYRAMKALEQMQKDEEFGASADPNMYRLFHEAVSIVKVKNWLGWDDNEFRFTNEEELRKFYELLVPYVSEDEEESPRAREPKIRTHLDIRDLKDIIGNIEAEEYLFDPNKTFNEALAVAKASATSDWVPRIKAATQTLRKMPTGTLKGLSLEEIEPMQELFNQLKENLSDWQKLTGQEIKL